MQFSVIIYRATTPEWSYAFRIAIVFISMQIRLAIIHIILDRFLEIYTNVRYPTYMSSKRLTGLLVLF